MNIQHFTNITSDIFGKFASCSFPYFIQNLINKKYVNMFNIDLSNYPNIESYKTLNQLFTREMIELPKIDKSSSFISPCDALITDCGKHSKSTAFQIKGMSYNIGELLTSHANHLKKVAIGTYINFYLSPKDYHRYHSPCDLTITKLIKIPGKLYPVNLKFLYEKEDLFIENERVVLECETKESKVFYLVFVGALNVGAISFHFEENIHKRRNAIEVINYDSKTIFFKKGDEMGCFMMGSTILILAENDLLTLNIKTGENIKFGDNI